MLASKSNMAYSESDFQNLAIILRSTYDDSRRPPTNPITYNPEKEIITLTACSQWKVNKAMTVLRLLVENFSTRWGRKYLMTSQPSRSRALMVDNSSARNSTGSGTARVFPVKPKENRRLVQIWFKSILPALPEILSPRLGEGYSASLISRGQSDLTAKPYIQIESPCRPGQKAQRVIKDLVSKIWEKDGHDPISMRFLEGSVKKLSGVEGADDDDGGESARLQRLDLNYNRPYSKPGMGASIGLLCSDKVSATLGGYVLISGEKYMLTSEHFVANSRELADRDDDVTVTSPSREDLKIIENNLKQNKRDIDSDINSLAPRTYGDRDIPENDFSDSDNVPPELREAMSKNDNVRSLLDQVTRPPLEYAVGTVKKLSLEVKKEIISRDLAKQVGLRNDELMVDHQMDWALIRVNSRIAHTGENRHKYRSNQDAMDDGFYENSHANQPGDVVYETCGAEVGYTVYYVGQRSKHRIGQVSVPTLDGSSGTLSWGILDVDGGEIPYSDVAGDSGAWVIRKEGNKLMGQVHSHAQGQVLFTPIDVIFADLQEVCNSEVSLPPCPPGLGQIPSTTPSRPLCSGRQTPPARAYQLIIPPSVASITPPETSPIEIVPPETRPFKPSIMTTTPSSTKNTHSQRSSNPPCDPPSSLPSLTGSPLSSVTTPEYPKSPHISGNTDFTNGQVDIQRLSFKSLPNIVGESEISDLSLDDQGGDQPVELEPYTTQFKFQSLPGTASSTRTSTWPIALSRIQLTKARRGSGFSRLRTSQKYAMSYSARAMLDKFARARRFGTFTQLFKTSI